MAKIDFNSLCKVNVTLACVCSQCRLCKLQNLISHGIILPLVEITTACPGSRELRAYYCPECYEYLAYPTDEIDMGVWRKKRKKQRQ